ncbi:MAG: CHAT domain-containing protein [Cyanobacteria bacterium P01_H01_bin.35]
MKTFRCGHPLSLLMPLLAALAATPTKAQPITPSNDNTGTIVNQNGNQFDIEGGTRSGANLFHSFDQFNVNSGQVANFLTTPDTTNILGRVTGGNASYINGLLQVIGSNSNLFLINPAGIMFGPNARLNIPASFSVTTATGIGFDNNNFWFKALGTNDYSKLVGNPSGYRFNVSKPGAIVNEANLSLNPGENLTLLGGTVINTGELSAPGGNITIAAVEGGSTLRISQPGHLLSLEVGTLHATSLQNGEDANITPLSLPELLTGGNITHASSVTVNADGDVVLTDSNTIIADTPGDVITSGNIDVSSSGNVGGEVNVFGDRVALIDTNINADGVNGGGTILIGGDFQGNGIIPNSQQTFVNQNSIISADAINNGDGGRVIIWSDGITNFAGNISAKGGEFSGDGGFVEVSGKQELIFDGTVDVSAAFGNPGTILLDPENLTVGDSENTLEKEEGNNSEIEATENSDNSESETAENNSEVQPNENIDSDTTENPDNLETETADNNSEVQSNENIDSDTTENPDNLETETADNNSEVQSNENIDSDTTENLDRSEIADNSEIKETETPIDPFAQDENADVTIYAENIEDLSGEIILQADNDITINEKIETDSSVEIKAGRSININADIDTSSGNGNITLFGNDNNANLENRSEGLASINQQEGTTLNAGSGTIGIRLQALGEIGDINLANLTTEGRVILNANSGNITQVSPNSLIAADKVILRTRGTGGIGLSDAPLRFDVNNLEALTGKGGIFIDAISSLTVGGVNGQLTGISTGGRRGRVQLNVDGNINLGEGIEAANNVRLTASESVNINADINTENGNGNIFIQGNNGEGNGNIIQAEVTSLEAGSGTIRIELGNVEEIGDVTLGNLTTTGGVLVNANGGNIESADENSLINAGSILLETSGNGGIGLSDVPLRLDVEKLEAVGGSGGVFFDVLGEINIGGVKENVTGISTAEGGDIELSAENKITVVEEISTKVNEGDAGNIIIESSRGGIDTQESEINASSELGNGGNITLTADINIQTNNINANATDTGGNIILNAGNSINTNDGRVSSSSEKEGGNIEITAGENIHTSDIHSNADKAGNIILNAGNSIDTTNGPILSFSNKEGGNIEITAGGNITTGLISSISQGRSSEGEESNRRGGDIILEAGGTIDSTRNLQSAAFDGDGGNITLRAEGNIFTQKLLSSIISGDHQGGNISLESGENIDTSKGTLNSRSLYGKYSSGGDISLKAAGNIITGSVYSYTSYGARGGNVSISAGGIIDTTVGAIESYSNLGNGGNRGIGGNVSISATDSVITGNITTFGGEKGGEIEIISSAGSIDISPGSLNSSAIEGTGANIILSAERNIYTGNIDSSGMEKGGEIQLSSNSGDVNTNEGKLTTSSKNGTDGDISINAYEGSIEVGDLDISTNITVADGIEEDINQNSNNIDAEQINDTEGEVTLQAHNDITINEPINSDKISNLEIKAGRNINVNADIDTSGGNGNITLSANDNNASVNYREPGKANITIAADTTLDAGEGNITIQMGTLGEVGDITLNNLRTTGTVTVDTPGGNIFRASDNSLVKADSVIFQTRNNGGVGLPTQPIRLEVNNLEARAGSGGVFFNSPTQEISIGNATDAIRGILTSSGGDVEISAAGEITVTEPISTFTNEGKAGNITMNSTGVIDTSTTQLISRSYETAGNITLNSETDIQTSNVDSRSFGNGNAGDITLQAGREIDTSQGRLESDSMSSNGGNITLEAEGNINTSFLSSATTLGETFKAGDITIISTNGAIDTTLRVLISNFPENMNLTDPIVASTFKNFQPNLQGLSRQGDGSNITIEAKGNITTGHINSYGKQNSGNVNITSTQGNIKTGVIFSISDNGTGGDINIQTIDNGNLDINHIASYSLEGTGANINLNSAGNIEIYNIASFGPQQSGDVNIQSNNGTITTNNIQTTASNGTSGNIRLNTYNFQGNINTADIQSVGDRSSGEVEVIAADGSIATQNIESLSNSGDSDDITVKAKDDVNTDEINSTGAENSGDIEVSSDNGEVSTGNIESRGDSGDSGNIDVDAENNINTENISTYANNNSGDIEVSSDNGEVNTGNIESRGDSGDSGNIDIDAESNINTENISTSANNNSGDIEVSSDNGEVNTSNIVSRADSEDSGNIDIDAENDINTENIITRANNNSGDIEVNSNNGSVNTQNVVTAAETGDSGNINVRARNNINTDNIRSIGSENSGDIEVSSDRGYVNANNIQTIAETGDSGDINVTARDDINTDNIRSIGGEDSGNISVTSTNGSVNTENVISQAETGSAGDIDISARNNINTGDITSTGLQGSGDINLTTRIGEISTGELFTDTGKININQANNNITLPARNSPFPIAPPFPIPPFPIPPLNTSAINEIPASIMIERTPQIPTNLPFPPTNNLTLPSITTSNNPGKTNNFFSTINSNQNPSTIISNLPNINNDFKLNSEIYSTYFGDINQFFQSNTTNINIPESMLIYDKIAKTMMLYNFVEDNENIRNYLYNENIINFSQIMQQSQILSRSSLAVDIARQEMISGLEKSRINEYSNYFGVNLEPKLLSTKSARDILAEMQQQTGKRSAVIYVNVYNDKLQLILFTADGQSILKTIHEVNRAQLKEIAIQFYVNIIDPKNRNSQSYLPLAQKLYNWLISPMTAELEEANIDTLLLSMDSGFRLLPVAALHDGEQFLIEKYNISLIPSLSLMNSNYNSLKNTQVLAMGASQFYDKPSLPAVPVELTSITQKLWQGNTFLNEEFTRQNLISQRQNYPYPIIHLATHAEFKSGDMSKSYIQLWDEKLQLDKIRELGWNNPEVELLVLSACRTAVGDQNAELGFAGLAIATGVKSALGSFWLVNDEATLGLMTEFYSHLGNVKIKAEALRKAQVAMLRGEVVIKNGKLMGLGSIREVTLPPELASIKDKKFSHPYYWAGFTMVGSPW